MKIKNIIAVAAALLFTVGAFAQGPAQMGRMGGPGGGHGGRHFDPANMDKEILTQINLTPAQSKRIDNLKLALKPQYAALMAGGGRPDRTKMMAVRKVYTDKLQKILSKGQYAKYQQLVEERRAKMRAAWGGGHGGPGGGGPGGGGMGGH